MNIYVHLGGIEVVCKCERYLDTGVLLTSSRKYREVMMYFSGGGKKK